MTRLLRKTLISGLILAVSTGAALAEVIKPFVLAGTSGGDVASVSALSLINISETTRPNAPSRMPSSA